MKQRESPRRGWQSGGAQRPLSSITSVSPAGSCSSSFQDPANPTDSTTTSKIFEVCCYKTESKNGQFTIIVVNI